MRCFGALLALCSACALLACSDTPSSPPVSQSTNHSPGFSMEQVIATPRDEAVGMVAGGGLLREGMWMISFGGMAMGAEGSLGRSTFVVQFHRVSLPSVCGGVFRARTLEAVNYVWPSNPDNCLSAAFMSLGGSFNGEPGWSLTFRVSDAGELEGVPDTVRFGLVDPSGELVYDSSEGGPGGDFPRIPACSGSGRSALDSGNLIVNAPPE